MSGARPITREQLPHRRASISLRFDVNGLNYTATYSKFADGRIAEIFLASHKSGSQADANCRDAAVAASLALQFGCPLDVLRNALLRDIRGMAATPLGVVLDLVAEQEDINAGAAQ
jgi:ribonucleoside-diphosphate reductase alpha chain